MSHVDWSTSRVDWFTLRVDWSTSRVDWSTSSVDRYHSGCTLYHRRNVEPCVCSNPDILETCQPTNSRNWSMMFLGCTTTGQQERLYICLHRDWDTHSSQWLHQDLSILNILLVHKQVTSNRVWPRSYWLGKWSYLCSSLGRALALQCWCFEPTRSLGAVGRMVGSLLLGLVSCGRESNSGRLTNKDTHTSRTTCPTPATILDNAPTSLGSGVTPRALGFTIPRFVVRTLPVTTESHIHVHTSVVCHSQQAPNW